MISDPIDLLIILAFPFVLLIFIIIINNKPEPKHILDLDALPLKLADKFEEIGELPNEFLRQISHSELLNHYEDWSILNTYLMDSSNLLMLIDTEIRLVKDDSGFEKQLLYIAKLKLNLGKYHIVASNLINNITDSIFNTSMLKYKNYNIVEYEKASNQTTLNRLLNIIDKTKDLEVMISNTLLIVKTNRIARQEDVETIELLQKKLSAFLA